MWKPCIIYIYIWVEGLIGTGILQSTAYLDWQVSGPATLFTTRSKHDVSDPTRFNQQLRLEFRVWV